MRSGVESLSASSISVNFQAVETLWWSALVKPLCVIIHYAKCVSIPLLSVVVPPECDIFCPNLHSGTQLDTSLLSISQTQQHETEPHSHVATSWVLLHQFWLQMTSSKQDVGIRAASALELMTLTTNFISFIFSNLWSVWFTVPDLAVPSDPPPPSPSLFPFASMKRSMGGKTEPHSAFKASRPYQV